MEDVPGALLGILPRWRLLPETVRGSAQLIRFFWSTRLSLFLQPSVLRPPFLLLSSPCVAVTQVGNPLRQAAGSTLGSSHRSVQVELHPPPSSLRRPSSLPPSCFQSRLSSKAATLPELPLHFFLECFVYREVEIFCDLVAHGGFLAHVVTSFLLLNFAFAVPRKNNIHDKQYNGTIGASQKETQKKPKTATSEKIPKDFQEDV